MIIWWLDMGPAIPYGFICWLYWSIAGIYPPGIPCCCVTGQSLCASNSVFKLTTSSRKAAICC